MADAELLLTINGADVTGDIWEWRSVTLTDSWTTHPTLSFTLRQPFGSVTALAAYDDVRLVNLLTGVVLFEGIIAPSTLEQEEVDPALVVSNVSCVGYQALLDTAKIGSPITVPYAPTWEATPGATTVIQSVLDVGFADARVNTTPRWATYPGGWTTLLVDNGSDRTWAQWTNVQQVIGEVLDTTVLTNAGLTSFDHSHPHIAKLIPGMGLVLTAPDVPARGSAPVNLTPASFGRPAFVSAVRDTSRTASAAVFTGAGDPPVLFAGPSVASSLLGYDPANGYVVLRDIVDIPYGQSSDYFTRGAGSTASFYRVVSPQMPHDVLVGHSITFNTARLGDVTGTVQSISTSFSDGVSDRTSATWPHFLNAGRALDGTWTLDAATASIIPRRMRTTTMTLSTTSATGVARSFVQSLRQSRAL
jgi:hypothetical protein